MTLRRIEGRSGVEDTAVVEDDNLARQEAMLDGVFRIVEEVRPYAARLVVGRDVLGCDLLRALEGRRPIDGFDLSRVVGELDDGVCILQVVIRVILVEGGEDAREDVEGSGIDALQILRDFEGIDERVHTSRALFKVDAVQQLHAGR